MYKNTFQYGSFDFTNRFHTTLYPWIWKCTYVKNNIQEFGIYKQVLKDHMCVLYAISRYNLLTYAWKLIHQNNAYTSEAGCTVQSDIDKFKVWRSLYLLPFICSQKFLHYIWFSYHTYCTGCNGRKHSS